MPAGFIVHAAIFSAPAPVNAQTEAEVERAVRARTAARALGTEARVSAKFRDKRRVTVAYADALEVKRKNRDGLSTGMKVLTVMSIVGFIGGFLNN